MTNIPRTTVARQVAAIAEYLTQQRPVDRMTAAARMAVALKAVGSDTAAVHNVLYVLPFPTGRITRGEYALRLRKLAWALEREQAPEREQDPNWAPGPVIP
ncbi:hypothetical protein, partial [Streptomyces sp. MBT51]